MSHLILPVALSGDAAVALNPRWARKPAPRRQPALLAGLQPFLHHPAIAGSTRGLTSEANSPQRLLPTPPAMQDCGRVCDRPGFCGPPRPVISTNRPLPEVIHPDFRLRRATSLFTGSQRSCSPHPTSQLSALHPDISLHSGPQKIMVQHPVSGLTPEETESRVSRRYL